MSNKPISAKKALSNVKSFERAFKRLSPEQYKDMTPEKLLGSLDTDLGRLQFVRLLGVLLKEGHSEKYDRPPAKATKAVKGQRWHSRRKLKADFLKSPQFMLIKKLAAGKRKRPVSDNEALDFIEGYGKSETNLGKCLIRAFHSEICNVETQKALSDISVDINKPSSTVKPGVAGMVATAASAIAVAISTAHPGFTGAAIGTISGGLSVFVVRVGLNGFCAWADQLR
jgi:hypothetical protein